MCLLALTLQHWLHFYSVHSPVIYHRLSGALLPCSRIFLPDERRILPDLSTASFSWWCASSHGSHRHMNPSWEFQHYQDQESVMVSFNSSYHCQWSLSTFWAFIPFCLVTPWPSYKCGSIFIIKSIGTRRYHGNEKIQGGIQKHHVFVYEIQ